MWDFIKSKRLLKWIVAILAICMISLIVSNYWVNSNTKAQLYSDVNNIPFRKVGLVLGASKKTVRGTNNFYLAIAFKLPINYLKHIKYNTF